MHASSKFILKVLKLNFNSLFTNATNVMIFLFKDKILELTNLKVILIKAKNPCNISDIQCTSIILLCEVLLENTLVS